MEKFLFALAFMLVLPVSTWQVFDIKTGQLAVHKTASSESAICFNGSVEDYDGLCTSPASPTRAYKAKLLRLRQAK